MNVGVLFRVYGLILQTLQGLTNDLTKFLATFANAAGKDKCIHIGTEFQMIRANEVQNAVYEQMESEIERVILMFTRRMREIRVLNNILEVRSTRYRFPARLSVQNILGLERG